MNNNPSSINDKRFPADVPLEMANEIIIASLPENAIHPATSIPVSSMPARRTQKFSERKRTRGHGVLRFL